MNVSSTSFEIVHACFTQMSVMTKIQIVIPAYGNEKARKIDLKKRVEETYI